MENPDDNKTSVQQNNLDNDIHTTNLVDHRVIGQQQKLFMFHEYSPGSCFFLPHGTKIYNSLLNLIRDEYHKRGYQEVITPNIACCKLWKKSGHWQHYRENMFNFTTNEEPIHDDTPESEIYSLASMNCPKHMLIFGSTTRSYRELPLRMADFGALHRNELHGALTGLTRVRRFCQDDCHIFCENTQIMSEIANCLDFIRYIYGIFGLTFSLALSTRPENYIGELNIWNMAEDQLKMALNASGMPWTVKDKDGAFYGPKIDIAVQDSLGRSHQCATIQLDFNQSVNFDLTYQKADGSLARPVVIHRAILGSVERMFAILCEHYAGKWPFWLSPRQICIVCVDPKYRDYASEIYKLYHAAGFNVEANLSRDSLKQQIKDAQLQQFNFIFVVGQKEQDTNTVNIRSRNNKILGTYSHIDAMCRLVAMKNEFSLAEEF